MNSVAAWSVAELRAGAGSSVDRIVRAVGSRRTKKVVRGDDLLYRFFSDLFAEDSELAQSLPTRMLAAMGIWLPLDVYHDWPILLPWVVRDPSCRGNRARGLPDEWGAPDTNGYLRDDNSLVKALPRSLAVRSAANPRLGGARMGTEFVASHVWRVVEHSELASRLPELNSFVPNLVWLPSQVAKLSDREGSPVQEALQGMGWAIYRNAAVAPHLHEVVEASWRLIPEPATQVEMPSDLNWFEPTSRFFQTRRQRLSSVILALDALADGKPVDGKVVTTRYSEGLPGVARDARLRLREFLRQFDGNE